MTQEQETGTIQRLTDRGFGFIRPKGASRNIFFHASALRGVQFRGLEEGDAVAFETTTTDRGPAAVGVEVIGRPLASLPQGAGDDDDANVYDWGAAS